MISDQLADMGVTIDDSLQQYWRNKLQVSTSKRQLKLDDVGDALLHALDEMLTRSSHFRQLVPTRQLIHTNRTVAVCVLPKMRYWAIVTCQLNSFVLEDIGFQEHDMSNFTFKDPCMVNIIKNTLSDDLSKAVGDFDGGQVYAAVDCIKVVVKQLTERTYYELSRTAAGALTSATTKAMKLVCDEVVGPNSDLCDRTDKVLGSMYIRTHKVTGKKYHVVKSAGKHLNACLTILDFCKEHLLDFITQRRNTMNTEEKLIFYNELLQLAKSERNQIEMLQITDLARKRILWYENVSNTIKKSIADLILVALNKNQQHIKAIAANYRHEQMSRPPSGS